MWPQRIGFGGVGELEGDETLPLGGNGSEYDVPHPGAGEPVIASASLLRVGSEPRPADRNAAADGGPLFENRFLAEKEQVMRIRGESTR